ncbi:MULTISPECIES: FAD-binding domain-containing protein [unclassified Thioalkalivibrio]|uniref:FAD-binding domain-containing protein n=1 Tax=unclassified Thioalkalivibrio TaxID=2621013 RepID=UPI00035D86E4|nr:MULTISPECIES: FAD-binding domain-containing protein [unclassified Thioalkalivibrio]
MTGLVDTDGDAPDERAALFPPSRAAALERLSDFVPRAGRHYAAQRNRDPGPGGRDNVSLLSPYIRHRAITENEVVARVLARHSPEAAEKFIQEVFWRTYWKGWLQIRPRVWQTFVEERDTDRARLAEDDGLREAIAAAEAGRSGVDGFDQWARELVATGYLHNHARMWFASIWIFTLRLPWTLGADFFLRHLLDADPASNTLGWRWVAGIQTPGKTYLATPDNIARFTDNRFGPQGLASEAPAIRDESPPAAGALPGPRTLPRGRRVLLLLHGDDFSGQEVLPKETDVAAIAVARRGHPDMPWPFGAATGHWVDTLAEDAARRAGESLQQPATVLPQLHAETLRSQCAAAGVTTIATPEAPVGPLADALDVIAHELAEDGIEVIPLRRMWDDLAWPHATHGFFRFKRQIPELLARNNL